MEVNLKPSKQFIDDFNLVLNHYDCTKEEAAFEKQRVMANFPDAERCYTELAREIRSSECTQR